MDRGDIVRNVAEAILGQPLVNNVFRGLVAEAVVDAALPETWKWCSGDWAAYDFLHADGIRLEVKQSAAKQTWHKDGDKPSSASFDIAVRTMDYVDNKWVPISERCADIYVFAYHPVVSADADHCDPRQWAFYVVPTSKLPSAKRISLSNVARLANVCSFEELAQVVEGVRQAVQAQLPGDRVISSPREQ